MDKQGVMHPKISTDHLKPFIDDTPHIPHRLQGPQCKRPHIDITGETRPSPSILPVDLTMSQHNQHPPSSPSSPLNPSPLDLSMQRLCSPVSHTTAVATLVPDDPTDAVHCINSAWAGNDSYVLLAKVGPYKVFYKDLQIGPGKKLESEVINSYLSLVVRQHNLISKEKAYHMDTFAITEMWKGRIERIKLDPTKYEIILGIVNEGDHWFLVVSIRGKEQFILSFPLFPLMLTALIFPYCCLHIFPYYLGCIPFQEKSCFA
ncbi:uncharacterized protein [Paramisgurnus dabryanus]|uniref:uncharacterized protein n=1 Tax=Paramisgurnus dabryanus TaxID=90735 RepID=UPI0031F3D248